MVGTGLNADKEKIVQGGPGNPELNGSAVLPDVAVLKKEVLRRFRSNDLEIPLLPRIATRIMKLSSDPNSSLPDFADLIKQDQFISGQIIRIANSPVFGGLLEITSLNRAIVQIGIRTVKDLVLGISMGSTVFRNPDFKQEMDVLWKHSMVVAFLSQEIAARCQVDVEHAFLCGLVHDIGKPFLVDVISKVMKKMPNRSTIPQDHLLIILDQLHQAVGGILARVWKFSDSITKAVSHHHEYLTLEGDPKKMANLVYTADQMAHGMAIGLRKEEPSISLADAFGHLGISPKLSQEMQTLLPEKANAYLESIG